jgi:DNA topoisomerase I
VREGRYGPYVNQGKVNATLPKALKPEDVTLEQALELIAERRARSGGGKKATARATPAKKTAAKKAAKKPVAKKTAGKAAKKKAEASA